MTWANDGVETTRMLVRGRPVATVTARFSIRNDGHLPFTVHGLDGAELVDWLSRHQATFAPDHPAIDEKVGTLSQITLRPGDEAIVFWSLDMACQPPHAEGSSLEIRALRFRVSWLGIRTTRELPLEKPITFLGDSTTSAGPSADCASG